MMPSVYEIGLTSLENEGQRMDKIHFGGREVRRVWKEGVVIFDSAAAPTEYALDFDGVEDYAGTATRVASMEPAGDFTAAVRFRADGFSAEKYPHMFANFAPMPGIFWAIFLYNTTSTPSIYVEINTGSGRTHLIGPAVALDTWYNATMWRSGTSLYLRLNGTTYGPLTVDGAAIANSDMRPHLGHYRNGGDANGAFEGLISRAAYWDGLIDAASLAAQEAAIDAHFAGSVLTGSPDHAWAINEGTGSTIADAGSVGGVTMNITGATWVEV